MHDVQKHVDDQISIWAPLEKKLPRVFNMEDKFCHEDMILS